MIIEGNLYNEFITLSRELQVCKGDIRRLEKASGYEIGELTVLFYSGKVLIKDEKVSHK